MARCLFSFNGIVRLVFLEVKELETPEVFLSVMWAAQITVKKLQMPEAEDEQKAVEKLKGNPISWKYFLKINSEFCSVKSVALGTKYTISIKFENNCFHYETIYLKKNYVNFIIIMVGI